MKPRILRMKSKIVIWGDEGTEYVFEAKSGAMKRNHEDSWIAMMQNENAIQFMLRENGLRFDLNDPRQELTHETFFEDA